MRWMLISVIISLYLIIILISFDPEDPSWMQSIRNETLVVNAGGVIGAQISDFLFFMFGSLAYIVPIFIVFYFWEICLKTSNVTICVFFLKFLKILVLLFTLCGLAQSVVDDVFYFTPGGIVGDVLCDLVQSIQNTNLYSILGILLLIGAINLMFFFNQILFYIIKITKKQIIHAIFSIFSKTKHSRHSCIRHQAYFKDRISPVIFLKQQPILCKSPVTPDNTLKTDQTSNQCSSIVSDSLNKSNIYSQFHLGNIKFISSIHQNISDQDNYRTKYTISKTQHDALHYNNTSYNYYHKRLINKIRLRKKKNHKTSHQYTKNIASNVKMFPLFKDQSKVNNTLLTYNIQKIPVDTQNTLKSAQLTFLNSKTIRYLNHSHIDNHINIKSCNKRQYNSAYTVLPDLNLLMTQSKNNITDYEKLEKISQLIEEKLLEYRITANVVNIIPGPVITRFELNLSAGIKSSKIANLSRDLARSLSIASVRIVDVIPGTPYVGLEIPNKKRNVVYLKDIISSIKFQSISSPLALVLGTDVSGDPVIEDLRCMPHLLVAGTTGSGKSVGINAMIISILYKATPEDVRFIMIDPKILELSIYSDIPHLLKQVITDTRDAESTLQWCVKEMEYRYKLMSKFGVRNLESYNHQIQQFDSEQNKLNYSMNLLNQKIDDNHVQYLSNKFNKLPYIVIVIDEFSDLMIMTTKTVEILITRLTQKARAAGIHLILSTQRPSVDVITGLIKANIPARIAFTVSSKIDSRTILGQSGAESLLGMGDMLYLSPSSSMSIRIHGACIQDIEIHKVVEFWKNQSKNFHTPNINI